MSESNSAPVLTPAQAKAELLAWAERSDEESARSGSSFSAMAVKGGLVVLGGLLLARLLSGPRRRSSETMGTGKRLISAALLARAGAWLLPHALRWIQTARQASKSSTSRTDSPASASEASGSAGPDASNASTVAPAR